MIIIKQTKLSNLELGTLGTKTMEPKQRPTHHLVAPESELSSDNVTGTGTANQNTNSLQPPLPATNATHLEVQSDPDSDRESKQKESEQAQIPRIPQIPQNSKPAAAEFRDDDGFETELNKGDTKDILEYLNVVVKSSLLLTFIIISKIGLMMTWILHKHQFGANHVSLTVGFVILAFDCLVDELCVVLLYKYSGSYYGILCECKCHHNYPKGLHKCYTRCCTFFALCYQDHCYSDQ